MDKSLSWICLLMVVNQILADDNDYNILNTDGSYDFRYDNPDSYHESHANRNNVVNGAFGARNPATGAVDRTEYTAGPRGFRPKGKNIARKYDLSQRKVGPIGNKDDPYFDPYEDPSYNFQFNTRAHSRKEEANRAGDVKGSYTYLDDVGDKHEVEYIAGKNTGFHVKSPYPDSYPNSYRSLYFKDPRKPYMRGRSFVQRGLDGSYRFASVGPDQRRTETSDSSGNVRGSYTYKDEKGVQHSVHYIAGPNIGYRVLKNVKGPHLPTFFPFNSPDIIPPDFYEGRDEPDVFAQAASTYVTPKPNKDGDNFPSNKVDTTTRKPSSFNLSTAKPTKPPTADSSDYDNQYDEGIFDNLFSGGSKPGPSQPPTIKPSTYRPSISTIKSQANKPTSKPQSISGVRPQSPSHISPTGSDISDGNNLFSSARPSGIGESSFGIKPSGSGDTSFSVKPTAFGGSNFAVNPTLSGENVFGTNPSLSDESLFDERPGSSSSEDDTDIFGTSSSGIHGPKPSVSSGNQRPRPSVITSNTRPRPTSITGSERPRPSLTSVSQRPRPSLIGDIQRPGSSIFDNSPRPSPPSTVTATKPVLQFDLTSPGEDGRFHTIITNLGETLFTAPPGVPVRAHVQSIGLIPLLPRSPSPSEQYNADIGNKEIDSEAANSHVNVATTSTTYTTSLTQPSIQPIKHTLNTTTIFNTSTHPITTALPETTTKS